MKKIITSTLLVLLLSIQGLQARSFDQIYSSYKTVRNCQTLSLSGLVLKLALRDADLPKGVRVNGMKFLIFEDECPGLTAYYQEIVNDLSETYELLMDIQDDGDMVRIFISRDENFINEMVMAIIDTSDNEAVIVSFKGRITPDAVEELIKVAD